MKITKEQNDILNSFKCERLSANAENKKLINSFISRRGTSLVSYFTHFGMEEYCGNYYILCYQGCG